MSFHRIVVGVDGTPESLAGLATARRLTAPGASIAVAGVAVLPTSAAMAGGIGDLSLVRENAERCLDGARTALAGQDGVSFVTPTATSVAAGLHALAAETGADLIVVGASRRHGIGEVLLGSDAQATLRGAPCAVLAGPAGETAALDRIGVAFDGLPSGRRALGSAVGLAAQVHAGLTVLAVIDTKHPYARYGTTGSYDPRNLDVGKLLTDEIAHVQSGLAVEPRVRGGDPVDQIVALSREVDLLVLGARRHGVLLRLLLGSVSGKVVRHAGCAVLVVPDGSGEPTSPPVVATGAGHVTGSRS